ncbi:fatty-acid amide hydrolase 2-B [Harpegnathos saltator]|uniref:fatty-acid amide hydrolase 2-B n=1 Tax=Harpegnathos saltator TaxID=610380 RepID=UPI00058D2EA1|nr:fatty-acid amide hydrolase 2-B [Harpegnathos saltator]
MNYVMRILLCISNIIYLMLIRIFSLIRYKKPPNIPSITDFLLTISATELAKKIRERKYTSYDVVRTYIERIKEVNPYINAVVDDRYEEALAEAKNCDALLKSGNVDIVALKKQKPLYGVPLTIKEACPVKGLSHTGCTLAHRGRKAIADGEVVTMLRDAGAIPLCVTNSAEMCGGIDTYNFLYGRSYNPYDTRYTTGGSSGGEAALLGAGASLIGIGSDFAGSIRIPGLFCGIFGLKPTSKVIPARDHYPTNENENFHNCLSYGPMTRYADDLRLFMEMISTKSNIDLCLDEPVDWKQTKVYYQQNMGKSFGILSMSPDLEQCILKAADYFSKCGIHTQKIPMEWPASLLEMTIMQFLNVGKVDVLIDINNSKLEKSPMLEMIKAVFGLSHHTMSLLFFTLLQQYYNFPKRRKLHYLQKFKEFQETLQQLLGKNGLLIHPTFRITAPFPELVLGEVGNIPYCALFNVLGFPAVQVPMGLNKDRMPMGVQIIAAPYQDRLCLAAAKELEIAFGGWVPPSIEISD